MLPQLSPGYEPGKRADVMLRSLFLVRTADRRRLSTSAGPSFGYAFRRAARGLNPVLSRRDDFVNLFTLYRFRRRTFPEPGILGVVGSSDGGPLAKRTRRFPPS